LARMISEGRWTRTLKIRASGVDTLYGSCRPR
jgi:hypothetical protein